MNRNIALWLFFLGSLLVPVCIYAVVNWVQQNKSSLPVLGTEENGREHRIQNFAMVDQQGKNITLRDWSNKIVIANFFFTHCPVVCPKMTRNLKLVQAALAPDKDVLICSFSVDPERDSVQRLREFASRFAISNNSWHLLTGDKKEIYRMARKSFLVVATDGDGGAEDFIHSDKLVLIDRHQRIRGYYAGTEVNDVQQLIKDLKRLKNEAY